MSISARLSVALCLCRRIVLSRNKSSTHRLGRSRLSCHKYSDYSISVRRSSSSGSSTCGSSSYSVNTNEIGGNSNLKMSTNGGIGNFLPRSPCQHSVSTIDTESIKLKLESFFIHSSVGKSSRYLEIISFFQYLHTLDIKTLDQEGLRLVQKHLLESESRIQSLTLPASVVSLEKISRIESLERQLFMNVICGMQNLAFPGNEFNKQLRKFLSILLHRKKSLSETKQNCLSICSSLEAKGDFASHYQKINYSLDKLLMRSGQSRNKIVFASSPKTPFAEYIMNSYSESLNQMVGIKNSYFDFNREKTFSQIVNGEDIQLVLSGLCHTSSEDKEVRDVIKMIAVEWFPLCSNDLTSQQLGLCFTSLHGKSTRHHEVRQLFTTLIAALMNCFDQFSGIDIGRILHSLKCCERHHAELQQRLLTVVLSKLKHSNFVRTENPLSVRQFSLSIAGLRNLSSDLAEGPRTVRRLMRLLQMRTGRTSIKFEPLDVSLCLAGLRGVKSDDKTVSKLLSLMSSGIIHCDSNRWPTYLVCEILFKIESSSFKVKTVQREILELISALSNKLRIAVLQTPITEVDLGRAMWSIREFTRESRQCLDLLNALADALSNIDPTVPSHLKDEKTLGRVLGAKILSAPDGEVDRFIGAFSNYLESRPYLMAAEEITFLILHLRHVCLEIPSSKRLISAISSSLLQYTGSSFTSRQAGLCMFGLSEFSNDSSEVQELLGAIHNNVLGSVDQMDGDDVCLALYGLKSCTHSHPELDDLLKSLLGKIHGVDAQPALQWDDYARMLPARHAGMFLDVLNDKSNPAFSMHSLSTAFEGIRNICKSLSTSPMSPKHEATMKRVKELQASLLLKLNSTNAPLNLTHVSIILNSLRFNHTEYYTDQFQESEINALNILAVKCVAKLCVESSVDFQKDVENVLVNLRRFKVSEPWSKVNFLNSIFPCLRKANVPLDYYNMCSVLILLANGNIDKKYVDGGNAVRDSIIHLRNNLEWALSLRDQSQSSWHWSKGMVDDMLALVMRIKHSSPNSDLHELCVAIRLFSTSHNDCDYQ